MNYFNLEEQGLYCPYCGERVSVVVDCSEAFQEYIEDCQVCCRPMIIQATVAEDGIEVSARQEND